MALSGHLPDRFGSSWMLPPLCLHHQTYCTFANAAKRAADGYSWIEAGTTPGGGATCKSVATARRPGDFMLEYVAVLRNAFGCFLGDRRKHSTVMPVFRKTTRSTWCLRANGTRHAESVGSSLVCAGNYSDL